MSTDGLEFELIGEVDTAIGHERIRVHHLDGHVHEFTLHDYEQLYAVPGAYEQIVSERLGCRSPAELAAMLGEAADRAGWGRDRIRVMDIAAGNGISGDALAAQGLHPVLGTDIVPAARAAALRDRPDVYDHYVTLDLLALTGDERASVSALAANALSCVAPVGEHGSELPPAALVAAAGLLAPDALVVYMHDPHREGRDAVTAELWREGLGAGTRADELVRRRYVHRRTVTGAPFEMDGVVWRLRRAQVE